MLESSEATEVLLGTGRGSIGEVGEVSDVEEKCFGVAEGRCFSVVGKA